MLRPGQNLEDQEIKTHKPEKPKTAESTESFSQLEKIAFFINRTHLKIHKLLAKTGKIGVIPNAIVGRIGDELIWQIHDRTGIIDKTDNKGFVDDLKDLKTEFNLSENSSTLYIGSSNDTAANRVFPGTMHVDLNKPRKMPRDFKFEQASAEKLPVADATVDTIIFKYFPLETIDKKITDELKRVLRPNGKILYHKVDPTKKHSAIAAFNKYGFRTSKSFPNGTVLLERAEGSITDEQKITQDYAGM